MATGPISRAPILPVNLRNGSAICARRYARHALPACAPYGPELRAGKWIMLRDHLWKFHGLGEAFKHAAGHGVGFAAANPNGRPRIHPLSPDVLEAGMTFNLEPAAYFDDYGGMRHCDLIAVTEDGARVMSDF